MIFFLFISGLCFATSTSLPCSSLDGPYCMYVNNKVPPVLPKIRDASLVMQHMPTKSREQKFSEALNTLSGIFKPLERKLTEAIRGRNKPAEGSFHVDGLVKISDGSDPMFLEPTLKLRAGKWVKRPNDSWITVGLGGSLRKGETHTIFTGDILDEAGEELEGCSTFSLKRENGQDAHSWTVDDFRGIWTGTYTCLGIKTLATLDIKTAVSQSGLQDGDEFKLTGLFNFTSGKRRPVSQSSGATLLEQSSGATLPEAVRQAIEQQQEHPDGQTAFQPIMLVIDPETGEMRQATELSGQGEDQNALMDLMQSAIRQQMDGGGGANGGALPVGVVNLDLDMADPEAREAALNLMERLGGASVIQDDDDAD